MYLKGEQHAENFMQLQFLPIEMCTNEQGPSFHIVEVKKRTVLSPLAQLGQLKNYIMIESKVLTSEV